MIFRSILKVGRIYDHILGSLKVVACGIFIASMLLINAEVFLRYVVNRPLIWGFEILEFGIILFTTFSLAWLLREEGHVKVDILLNRLKPKPRVYVIVITSALSALALLLLVGYGMVDTLDLLYLYVAYSGGREVGYLRFPTAFLLLSFALGLFLFCIQFIRRSYIYFKLGGEERKEIQDRGF